MDRGEFLRSTVDIVADAFRDVGASLGLAAPGHELRESMDELDYHQLWQSSYISLSQRRGEWVDSRECDHLVQTAYIALRRVKF